MRITLLIPMIILSVTAMMSGGCARKVYVAGETRYVNRVDTIWHERLRQDSVVSRDSVLIETNGDTVRQTIVRERWRTRTLTDTLRILSRDTVRVTVNQPIAISQPTKKKQTRAFFSRLITIIAIVGGIMLFCSKRHK